MTSRNIPLACALSALALVAACSSSPSRNESVVYDAPSSSRYSEGYGHVSRIEVVPVSSRSSGGGAILGAVIGGVLGNQIERRNKRDDEVYRVSVRLDNGANAQFDYQRIDDLRVGDRIRVQDGQLHRV